MIHKIQQQDVNRQAEVIKARQSTMIRDLGKIHSTLPERFENIYATLLNETCVVQRYFQLCRVDPDEFNSKEHLLKYLVRLTPDKQYLSAWCDFADAV